MAESGKDFPEFDDIPFQNIDEDLHKLYLQTVFDTGFKGEIVGPQEIIEDFALVLSDRLGGKHIWIIIISKVINCLIGKNETIESAGYVLSSAVILSIAQSVFEVGASIKDVNLHVLKLHHQINKNIEEKKIDKMMLNPLKVANELFKTGFNEIKAKRNEDAQKTFITISDKASEALANLEDKKLDIDTFKLCIHALKMIMFSKIAMYCFNLQSKTFLPYSNYPKYFQEQIAEELENLSIKSLMLKNNVEVKPSIFLREAK